MSLQYLLDGYNIIHQIQSLSLKNLESQRIGLVRLIETQRLQGSTKNLVTIVFDGKSGYTDQTYSQLVKVVFSQDESADDKILKIVEKSGRKKSLVVVTNDRTIQILARQMGAKVMKVQAFLGGGKSFQKKTGSQKIVSRESPKEKKISKVLEHKINSEFEEIWLKSKKKKE